MNRKHRTTRWRIATLLAGAAAATLLLILVGLMATPSVRAQSGDPATPTQPGGANTYVVQVGDSWSSVAARNGVKIDDLKKANPQALRPSEWLLVGETLVIPGKPASTGTGATGALTATQGSGGSQKYIVGAGESWNSIAQKFGISADLLQTANPRSVRAGLVLFRGEEILIPVPGATAPTVASTTPKPPTSTATPAPTATPTEEPTATPAPTEEPTAAATEAPTAAATEVATEVTTETATPENTEQVAAATEETVESATAEAAAGVPPCPEEFAAYPDLLVDLIDSPIGGIEGVLGYLRDCSALAEDGVQREDWTGDGSEDLAIIIENPKSDAATPETDLLIFNSDGEGYKLGFRARAGGQVKILAAEDVNADGKPDIVWVDTTCGANTCFDTVNIRSWDGSEWKDWTDKTITMAYADVSLDDVRDTADGQEIQLTGGVYGSVGAGPQRGRSEVWGSVAGAPYTLLDKVYDRSNCLYFKVLDANEALQRFKEIGLVQAKEMYTEAVTNRNLAKCWEHDNELDELRGFSLFRLALIGAYEGQPDAAAESIDQLQQAFPETAFAPLGAAWLQSYQTNQDIAESCAVATQFAKDNPESYAGISDYGYANPTFLPEELCPILDIEVPEPTPDADATATETAAATPAATATLTTTEVAPVIAGQEGDLPECPASLEAYATALPSVIEVAGGDALIIETWLRLCEGMADDRGGMLLDDFNSDGILDALFLPTIVSDLGFGPEGAQGAVLLYHGNAEQGYDLVYSPDVFGQPTIVTTGDVNGDGSVDLAWTVEGCSTFCIKEVQVITWDPDKGEYVSIIDPGATIAEGVVRFEDLPAGAPGKGKQLVLEGGVSGTPEGGLAVPHTEVWQSIAGQPFRRLSWSYDRETSGSSCVGLRLIEADVALQASDVLGYGPAADAYRSALDPALRACSIFGIPGDQELKIIQGLGYFRLMETEALSGTLESAKQTLETLTTAQPDETYTKAATQWLAEFEQSNSAAAACAAVQTIFDRETLSWQITDHFGYNHPALAPEQVCFTPKE